MKRIAFVIVLFISFGINSFARKATDLKVQLSANQISLGCQYHFPEIPVWSELYFGLGNQDINREFDDWVIGLKVGIPVFSFERSKVYTALNAGVYLPENVYYKANAVFGGLLVGYQRYIGKQDKHSLFAEVGYVYGRKDYFQSWENDRLKVSTTDEFKLAPVSLSIGYSFRF